MLVDKCVAAIFFNQTFFIDLSSWQRFINFGKNKDYAPIISYIHTYEHIYVYMITYITCVMYLFFAGSTSISLFCTSVFYLLLENIKEINNLLLVLIKTLVTYPINVTLEILDIPLTNENLAGLLYFLH